MFRSFMAAGVRREASGNRILVRGALIFQRVIFRGGFPAFRRFGMRYSPDVGCGKSWLPREGGGPAFQRTRCREDIHVRVEVHPDVLCQEFQRFRNSFAA